MHRQASDHLLNVGVEHPLDASSKILEILNRLEAIKAFRQNMVRT